MHAQIKTQYPAGQLTGANAAIPAPTRQVEGQIDSLNFSLDAMQDTVNDLIRRLEPVTGGFPESKEEGCTTASQLVPVAARLSYINSRVNMLHSRLSTTLNALEI
jgi:hypothetical protein